MSEFAPTITKERAPVDDKEAIITELVPKHDDSQRFEDVDFAHTAAIQEDMQRDRIDEARANVERALAQNSPLVEKYNEKLTNATVELTVNSAQTEKFYDKHYRQAKKTTQGASTDDLRLAA